MVFFVFFCSELCAKKYNFPHVYMLQTPWCYFHLPQQEPYLYSMSGNEVEVKVDSNATISFKPCINHIQPMNNPSAFGLVSSELQD